MTQMAHRACDEEYGCTEGCHTADDCYWRYADTAADAGYDVMSYARWVESRG